MPMQTSTETFFRTSKFYKAGEEAPPIFIVDGVSYLSVKVGRHHFLSLCQQCSSSPAAHIGCRGFTRYHLLSYDSHVHVFLLSGHSCCVSAGAARITSAACLYTGWRRAVGGNNTRQCVPIFRAGILEAYQRDNQGRQWHSQAS